MSNTKKPVSPKQLAANRANASHSTGPRTPEGKARSAQNSRKHGFTASHFAVVRLEDLEEVDHLRADLIAIYQPANSQELFAIERIALAQQAILRIARLESGLLTSCLNDALDTSGQLFISMSQDLVGHGDIEITKAQNRNYALADGFQRMTSNKRSADYQVQAQAGKVTVGAEFKGHSLPTLQGTLSTEEYVVIETGLFGSPGARIKLSSDDFSLRINGKKTPLPSQP